MDGRWNSFLLLGDFCANPGVSCWSILSSLRMTSILTDELFEQGPEPILLVDKGSPAVPAPEKCRHVRVLARGNHWRNGGLVDCSRGDPQGSRVLFGFDSSGTDCRYGAHPKRL